MESRALERLKWRSRRGLLELDLVFTRFWAGVGATMTEADAQALEKLLAMPDNDLLDLVMGRIDIPDEALRELVGKLRAA
jgi:antitoxin CptB